MDSNVTLKPRALDVATGPFFSIREVSAPSLMIGGGNTEPLLTLRPDGTVEGRVEDAGEAARVFIEALRTLWPDALRDVRAEAYRSGFAAGRASAGGA